MTATATSLAPVQRNANLKHNVRIFRKHFEAIRSEPEQQLTDELPVTLPGIVASESATMIRLLVPLEGVDIRHVYIFASPSLIVLEVLTKSILKPSGPVENETQRYRITRELKLRDRIAKGSTTARLFGDSLEITSIKTASTSDEAWTEFIQIDTRCSLGLCEPPTLQARLPSWCNLSNYSDSDRNHHTAAQCSPFPPRSHETKCGFSPNRL